MNLGIRHNQAINTELAPFEAVERKGLGHPDTLCDAIAELASSSYSAEVYSQTGHLPHHYFDKVVLMGGASSMGLGFGDLIEPYRVLFAGKVTRQVGKERLPVTEIVGDAAKKVLETTLFEFDGNRHLMVLDELRDYQGPSKRRPRYQPERIEDMPVLDQQGRVSNDVNICTGYYPFSKTERTVLETERFLNSDSFKTEHPYTGMDIKVAGVRVEDQIGVTVNMPFISSLVGSMKEYRKFTKNLVAELVDFYDEGDFPSIDLEFNPQDISGLPYLTVTGSVADTGDIGVVGRGNRANGLITPMRPMSIEAVSGKSPIDNTGKMYGIIANRLAEAIYEATRLWNNVTIVTFRDRPLDDPANVLISLGGDASVEQENIIKEIVEDFVSSVPRLTSEIIFQGVISW